MTVIKYLGQQCSESLTTKSLKLAKQPNFLCHHTTSFSFPNIICTSSHRVCLSERKSLFSPGITVRRSVGDRALKPKLGPPFPAIVPTRFPNTRRAVLGGVFPDKKQPGWLPVIQAGSQPQTCFYLYAYHLSSAARRQTIGTKRHFG